MEYPEYPLCRRLLGEYCISAELQSERDFSSVGRTVTDMRSRLNENTELLRLGNACSINH